MKTDYFLKSHIELPDDISKLVQQVYDTTTDAQVPDIAEAKASFVNKVEQKQYKASQYQVDKPALQQGQSIIDWLTRRHTTVATDQQVAAAVRDIKETLEVILLQHTDEGDFLLDGRSLDKVSSKEIAQQTLRLPAAVTENVNKTVQQLEKMTWPYHAQWQDDVWLRGALVLPLDQDLNARLDKWNLSYSAQAGLSYSEEE